MPKDNQIITGITKGLNVLYFKDTHTFDELLLLVNLESSIRQLENYLDKKSVRGLCETPHSHNEGYTKYFGYVDDCGQYADHYWYLP